MSTRQWGGDPREDAFVQVTLDNPSPLPTMPAYEITPIDETQDRILCAFQ